VIRALFFDAAGTLIEPAEPVAVTYTRLLSPHLGPLNSVELGASFGPAFKNAGQPDYSDQQDGDAAEREWWRRVVELTVGRPVSEDAFGEVFDHYARAEAWRIFPEVVTVLERAAEIGLRSAVVSNFDLRLHRILEESGLRFELVMTSAEARARKPLPAIFFKALQILGLEPEEALHVGDSEQADLIGAKTSGIEAYLLKRPANDLSAFMEWVEQHRV
jgi:putative hydrolase of the HAD superfamily